MANYSFILILVFMIKDSLSSVLQFLDSFNSPNLPPWVANLTTLSQSPSQLNLGNSINITYSNLNIDLSTFVNQYTRFNMTSIFSGQNVTYSGILNNTMQNPKCNYTQSSVSYSTNLTLNSISDITTFGNFSISSTSNGLLSAISYNNGLKEVPLSLIANYSEIANMTFFKPIFFTINSDVFLLIQKSVDSIIYMFNVSKSSQNLTFNSKFSLNTSIPITSAVFYNNTLLIGTSQGIFLLKNNLTTTNSSQANMSYFLNGTITSLSNVNGGLNVNSLIIINNYLYISVNNVGLRIIDLNNYFSSKLNFILDYSFNHSQTNTLDIVKNQITGNFFLGLSLKGVSSNSLVEVLVEFYLQNLTNPAINKVFLLRNNVTFSSIINDGTYSYLFDKTQKNLYLIRRGVSNNLVDRYNYVVNLSSDKNSLNASNPLLIKNQNSLESRLMLTNSNVSNGIIEFTSLQILPDTFKCSLDSFGNYTFMFAGTSDSSAGVSTDNNNFFTVKYTMSYIYQNFSTIMNVINGSNSTNNTSTDSSDSVNGGYIALAVIIAVVVIVIIVLVVTKCFKKCRESNSYHPSAEYNPAKKDHSEVVYEIENKI